MRYSNPYFQCWFFSFFRNYALSHDLTCILVITVELELEIINSLATRFAGTTTLNFCPTDFSNYENCRLLLIRRLFKLSFFRSLHSMEEFMFHSKNDYASLMFFLCCYLFFRFSQIFRTKRIIIVKNERTIKMIRFDNCYYFDDFQR